MNFNNLNQLYRSVIMDHYKTPRNKGVIDDGTMTVDMNNPTCGDAIRLTFRMKSSRMLNLMVKVVPSLWQVHL